MKRLAGWRDSYSKWTLSAVETLNPDLAARYARQAARYAFWIDPSLAYEGRVRLTEKQAGAVDAIRAAAEQKMYGDRSKYEFKRWEVVAYESFVAVSVVVGRKNDEGTMASVVARDYGHFYVGRKGGIKTALRARESKSRARDLRKYPLIYGWHH